MNRNDPNYTNYNNRSADYYMGQIPLDVLDKLTEEDKNSIKSTRLNRCFGEVKKGESPTKRLAKLYPFS
jgi:hypothetical protein